MTKVYWKQVVKTADDFGRPIRDEFIDGATRPTGQWAIMTPETFKMHGVGLGVGKGQRYKKQEDGKWLKVEG